ncbi:hypothetical protein Tco_1319974 [Tanacetum coccineum]
MSTRSSSSNLIPPFSDPESVIRNRRRKLGDPSLLLDFEGINMNPNNVHEPPPAGPPPQNHNVRPRLNFQNPAPDLRTMEELCQPTMNFHRLPGDDANKNLDKFLTITHSIKQNVVTDDALRLYLFPYSLTRHATAWFDRLPKNSIHTFQEMASKFLSKYFPPSMVTKLRNDINTFYNGLTLRHRDTINAAAGETFMKRRLEECYDLIENMTAHHNDWDTSAHRGESSGSTTSSSSEIAALAQQMIEIRKDMLQMYRSNQNNSRDIQSVHCINVIDFLKDKPISGNTTSPSDSFPSSPLDETSDYSLDEFADELSLLEPFLPRNEDDNFDHEADLREIEYLFN